MCSYLFRMEIINLSKLENEILEQVWYNQGLDTKEIAECFNIETNKAYRILKKIRDKTSLFDPIEQLANGELDFNSDITRVRKTSLFWYPVSLDDELEDYCNDHNFSIQIQ